MFRSQFKERKSDIPNTTTEYLSEIISAYHTRRSYCPKIYLSYIPQNAAIADFYASVGFKTIGEIDPHGEIIMCLAVNQSSESHD